MTFNQFIKYLKGTGQRGMVYLDTLKGEPIIEYGTCVYPTLTEHCEGMERKEVTINSVVKTSGYINYFISLSENKSLFRRMLDILEQFIKN